MWPFREIVIADSEFATLPGERPVPTCFVGHELISGRTFRIFQPQFGSSPPWATGPDVPFVAYYSSAEFGCYREIGWPLPERVIDLFVEFRNLTNGLVLPDGVGLLGALAFFGLDGIGATEKREMQQAIGSDNWRGRYTSEEILDYCEQDVVALKRLFVAMWPRIDLPRALLRGRAMIAASAMEHSGVPIDMERLTLLRERWASIQDRLIRSIDVDFGVYEGRTFKVERFNRYLIDKGIPWSRLESGNLALDDGTFRQQAKAYPVISPLRELRSALADLRLNDLSVGRDGRNRCMLSAFRSRSSRFQPSNSRYIFGPSVWLRGLVRPPPGHGIAYIDYAQQEFGIAAALSGDRNMQAAYRSGDPYLAFAKQARAVPSDATKDTHAAQRELFKQCVLGVQYGMEAQSLALRIAQPEIVARNLLHAHRETYATFWTWSEAAIDVAMLHGSIHTVFGWVLHIVAGVNPRAIRNFPMQANGAEILRIACCLASERGIEVCAPVHDAVLICAPLERLDADIASMRAAMAEASRAVLSGFELGTDVYVVRYPDRYMDEKRGRKMWDRVMALVLDDAAAEARCA
jgi:hypothetical protein